jgi:hypothetical protein
MGMGDGGDAWYTDLEAAHLGTETIRIIGISKDK